MESLGFLFVVDPAVCRFDLCRKNFTSDTMSFLDKRNYNILFHIHTISGIIISVGLYVIFFAGSFSFFRDEIIAWERNEPVEKAEFQQMNLNRMIHSLGQEYNLYSRDISFTQYYQTNRIGVGLSAPKDTTVEGSREFLTLNTENMKRSTYTENYSIGEFLYRLHFFAQLNHFGRSGYALAGLVSLFFLFAILTGILVHWKKIISNFYLFRPKAKLKTIWTDAHTALGVIGFPLQFMYAITGAFFIFGAIAMGPVVSSVMYDGNAGKMYKDLGPKQQSYPLAMEKTSYDLDWNNFVDQTKADWNNFKVRTVKFINYGDENMHVAVIGHPKYSEALTGQGKKIFNASTGAMVFQKDPSASNYYDAFNGIIDRLHFGDFGGLGLRIVYFILGIVSCFVIISGILIWLTARDKKYVAPKKRKFNSWMGHVFLSACLGLYPTTAFTFVTVKLFVSGYDASRMTTIYHIFFYFWLAIIVLLTIKRDDFFTNKFCLLLGAAMGILIPVANGIISGNWLWETFSNGYFDIFFIDALWIVLSVATFIIGINLKKKQVNKYQKKKTEKRENIKKGNLTSPKPLISKP